MPALPPPGADDALYLVDIAGWIHRTFHAMPPMATPTGEPVNAVGGVAGMLVRLLVDRQPGYLGVAADSSIPGFRHALFPAYKAARPPRHPDLVPQYERVRQIVMAHRIPILEAPGFEADDAIAAATRRGLAAGLRVVIVAHDKDLCQLVSDRVVVWDGRDRVTGPEEVRARWGVGPERLGDLLALAGDASDGVPGIPGVGAKTAADLLSRRGSLEEVLLKADWEASRTLRAKLHRHAEDARMSRRLVELRADAPIRFDPAELRVGWGEPGEIQSLYTELGFTRLAGEVVRLDKPAADPEVVAAAARAEAEAGAETGAGAEGETARAQGGEEGGVGAGAGVRGSQGGGEAGRPEIRIFVSRLPASPPPCSNPSPPKAGAGPAAWGATTLPPGGAPSAQAARASAAASRARRATCTGGAGVGAWVRERTDQQPDFIWAEEARCEGGSSSSISISRSQSSARSIIRSGSLAGLQNSRRPTITSSTSIARSSAVSCAASIPRSAITVRSMAPAVLRVM